jgi:hypothetical protein
MNKPFLITRDLLKRLKGRIPEIGWNLFATLFMGREFNEVRYYYFLLKDFEEILSKKKKKFTKDQLKREARILTQKALHSFYRNLKEAERMQLFLRREKTEVRSIVPFIRDRKLLEKCLAPDVYFSFFILKELKNQELAKSIYRQSTDKQLKIEILDLIEDQNFLFETAFDSSFLITYYAIQRLKDIHLLKGLLALRPEMQEYVQIRLKELDA